MPYFICLLVMFLTAAPVLADAERYVLQREQSRVGFTYWFGANSDTGTMPVSTADLWIDLDRPQNSSVDVTLDAHGARTGFFAATQALRGESILHTRAFPFIRFRSTRITPQGDGARVEGDVTIRGVIRPLTLEARFFRPVGTALGDHDNLVILLSGSISRSNFGADGFADQVGDTVNIRILAHMRRVGI